MKLAGLLSGACAGYALFGSAGANYLQDSWTFENGVLRGCDAMPDEATVSGTILSLLAPVMCATPKVLNVYGDATIRSYTGIRMYDVAIHLHGGAHLRIMAPSIMLERSTIRHSEPILRGDGAVEFVVGASLEQYLQGSLSDEHRVVALGREFISSNHDVRYTSDGLVVAHPSAPAEGDDFKVELRPETRAVLVRAQERLAQIGGSIPSVDHDGSTSSTGDTSDEASATSGTTDSSTTTGTTSTIDDSQSSGHNNPASADPRRDPWTPKREPVPRDDDGRVDSKTVLPDDEPIVAVKVGDVLVGKLASKDGSSAVYFGGAGASLRFARTLEGGPRDRKGRRIGLPMQSSTTLLPSDPKKLKKVLRRRENFSEEELRGARGAKPVLGDRRDGTKDKRTKLLKVLGLLPYGKHGFRERRAREHALAHLGEVTLTIDRKGTVEGSVDGTVVLRRRSPSFFGYRRKDSTYQMQADDKGLAVMRRGRRVWGIEAPEIWLQM